MLTVLYTWIANGGGGSRTRVHASKPSASTGLVKRGVCREKVAASQASFPYLERSPAMYSRLHHSKSLSATEFSGIRNSIPEIPAQLLTQQVLTVRFQTLRLLYVLQLFFCQFKAPSRLPAAHDFSCLSKPVHPRKSRPLHRADINAIQNRLPCGFLFSVSIDAVALLLETLEHCNTVLFVVIDKSAVPIFQGCKQCVAAVLIIRPLCLERNKV